MNIAEIISMLRFLRLLMILIEHDLQQCFELVVETLASD